MRRDPLVYRNLGSLEFHILRMDHSHLLEALKTLIVQVRSVELIPRQVNFKNAGDLIKAIQTYQAGEDLITSTIGEVKIIWEPRLRSNGFRFLRR